MAIKIAIDAGHGSNTAGKRTPDGYREHYINVKTAYYCEQFLNAYGIQTVRIAWNDLNSMDDSDVSLSTRQKQIKAAKCDYSISFHANAAGSGWNTANGVETLIHCTTSKQADSRRFATAVQNRLIQGTKQSNRGVKTQELAMCNCTAMGVKAACLVEIGFMTNQYEAGLMKTDIFCKEQGEDCARGILDYLGIAIHGTSTSTPTPTTPTISTQSSIPLKVTSTKKDIQTYLNTYYSDAIKAVLGAKLVVDGVFGAKSKKAIAIAIQVELNKLGAGLKVDGLFGSSSATAFTKYVGSLKKGSKGIFVTLWQCLLVGLGYNPNGIDGDAGNGFVSATNLCLKAYGLLGDSIVNGLDINKLL